MSDKKVSYKLLSIDLDGTLLSPILRRVRSQDCRKLQEYMSLGGLPMINTGRAPWAITKTIKKVNRFGQNKIRLLSCLNGSYIHDFNDGRIIESKISHEYVKKIFEIVKQTKGASIWFYKPHNFPKGIVETYPNMRYLNFGYHLSKIRTLKDESDLTSFKLDILSTNKNAIATVYHNLIKQNLNHVCTLSHSSPRLIEVTALHVNKGRAIDYYANKYGINKNEICSLGDSFNDLSAFKNSALSIGINPKNPNLLEHCDAIVDHKTKGVSEAIDRYLIKQEIDSKYKLIFADLDGTLIDGKTKLFSNLTKVALQQCTNHLIPIAIASGRGIYDGMNIVKSMQLNPKTNIYIIGNNGATIYDIYTNKYVSQTPLDESDARKVFEHAIKLVKDNDNKIGFIIHQHSQDLLFYNAPFWKVVNFKKTGLEDQYDPWIETKPVYINEYPKDVICYKFVIKFPDHEKALTGCEELKKKFPNLEICLSSPVNVEVNKKGVNKGFAAQKLSEKTGISVDNFLALGDGQNDIATFKVCKNSFAPSYAPDFVKKEAANITENVTVSNFASETIYNNVLKKTNIGK